jgi:DNA-nicking Smr family endonuclease
MGRRKKKRGKTEDSGAGKRSPAKQKKRKPEEPPPFHNPFLDAADELKKAIKKPARKRTRTRSSPPKEQKARPSSDELDQKAFDREMADVQPLDPAEPRKRKAGRPRTAKPGRDEDAEVLAQLADLVAGVGPFDIADTAEYVEGIPKGLDRRLLDRLKQGDFSVQAHLDLHGLSWEEAKKAVSEFLHRARLESRRCVLVVCGRGHHSRDKEPVLKNQLVRWMSRSSASRLILAFCTARPHDGGAGALYILLRR